MRVAAAICILLFSNCAAGAGESDSSLLQRVRADNVARYHGCPVFTAGDWYNAPVVNRPADKNSDRYIDSMYRNGDDGGFVVYNSQPPAYRVNIASSHTPKYAVRSVQWHQNEFPKPVPWFSDFYIEPQGDGHAIVLDTQQCELTEFYQAKFSGGELAAYSGWTWDLRAPLSSPGGNQPSSMASGLPIFAGMLKGEEIESSAPIAHALNMAPPAGSLSPQDFVAPATSTGGCGGCAGPPSWAMPYGAHLRLRADFHLTCKCPQTQRIALALKIYGAYIADTGSPHTGNQLYVSQDVNGKNPWDASDLENLEQIHITDMQLMPLPPIQRKGS